MNARLTGRAGRLAVGADLGPERQVDLAVLAALDDLGVAILVLTAVDRTLAIGLGVGRRRMLGALISVVLRVVIMSGSGLMLTRALGGEGLGGDAAVFVVHGGLHDL